MKNPHEKIKIQNDEGNEYSLSELIENNPDLHKSHIKAISKLEIGDSHHIGIGGGWTELKRIA